MSGDRPRGLTAPILLPALLASLLAGAACTPRLVRLPTDAGTPLADAAQVHAQVASACAGLSTFQAEIALSGRAGGQRVRGRVHAGFARPASMRLEAVAPAGGALFILTGHDGAGTLLLQRERRVVTGAPPEALLDKLTGVRLAPADLLAVLTGCVTVAPRATNGRLHAGGWASIDLEGGATLYLRRTDEAWEVRAARRDGWHIEYGEVAGGLPRTVRLQDASREVDLSATLSQVTIDADIPAGAFVIDNTRGMVPMSIDELRSPLDD